MNVEIVTIGDELLLGFTVDTNAAFLARELAALGIGISRRTTVGDDPAGIAEAVRDALQRAGAVITTGGLGPTADDMTKPAVAGVFGRGMHLDEAHVAWMRDRWRTRFGREMPESNVRQAVVPDGCELLHNAHGSAPGIWLEDEQGRWVAMLPGVPREMKGMSRDALLPRLRTRLAAAGGGSRVVRSRTLRTTGVAESLIADRVAELAAGWPDLTLAYLPGAEGVDLRVTVRDVPAPAADARLQEAATAIQARLGAAIYGEDTQDLAAIVLAGLRARGRTLAVAESCTGGMLGARITAVPGASDVFLGGAIAYANEVKVAVLGVDPAAIQRDGAVSEPVVRRMATGARERTGASVGIGITGIAGPDGGSEEKPVGTVWIGLDVDGTVEATRVVLSGDRDEVRRRAAQAALDLLRRRLAPG